MVVILGAMMAFAPFSIDMYLPALPTLEHALATDMGRVQWTLASFFVGFAVGQAFYGPLSDRFGRKPPLYVGLLLYISASIGCAFAPSIEALIGLRLVQALGACAGAVTARAVVRDHFPPRQAARVFSALTLVFGVAPIVAPLIGGYLLLWSGWPAIFWALAAIGVVIALVVVLRLPETHPAERRQRHSLGPVLGLYGGLLIDRTFLGYALSSGISLAGLFAFISGSPYVFIELYRVSAQSYGWLFGVNAFGYVLASQLNGRLVRSVPPERPILPALLAQAMFGMFMLGAALSGIGGLYGVAVPLFFYIAAVGFVVPNATALAMAPHGDKAGIASALFGTLQFSLAAIIAFASGGIHNGSAVPMVAIILICGGLGLGFNRLLIGGRRGAPLPPDRYGTDD
jgi:DHA1 family bicyclomycin/chloramphenicol resistance-like MFS transporter